MTEIKKGSIRSLQMLTRSIIDCWKNEPRLTVSERKVLYHLVTTIQAELIQIDVSLENYRRYKKS